MDTAKRGPVKGAEPFGSGAELMCASGKAGPLGRGGVRPANRDGLLERIGGGETGGPLTTSVRPSGRRQRKTPVAHTFSASPRVLVFLAPAPRKKLGRLCHTAVLPLGLPSRRLSLVRDEGAQIWGQQRGKGRAACNVPGITGEYGIIPQRKGRGVGVSSRCGHEVSVLLGSPGQHRHYAIRFRVPSEELLPGAGTTPRWPRLPLQL